MDPLEFINLGKKLLNDTNYNEEIRYRCSISRIYYGILHFLVLELGIKGLSREGYHKKAIDKINSISPDNGSFLLKVQEFRNNADYNLSKDIGLREVNRFKLTCKAILKPYLIQLD